METRLFIAISAITILTSCGTTISRETRDKVASKQFAVVNSAERGLFETMLTPDWLAGPDVSIQVANKSGPSGGNPVENFFYGQTDELLLLPGQHDIVATCTFWREHTELLPTINGDGELRFEQQTKRNVISFSDTLKLWLEGGSIYTITAIDHEESCTFKVSIERL